MLTLQLLYKNFLLLQELIVIHQSSCLQDAFPFLLIHCSVLVQLFMHERVRVQLVKPSELLLKLLNYNRLYIEGYVTIETQGDDLSLAVNQLFFLIILTSVSVDHI